MMEMMTTPGRGGGATGGLGATVEDGGGGRGGGGGLGGSDNGGGSNNNRSSNSNNNNISSNSNNNNSGNINNSGSLNKGRPEPHIEEAMFDLDPDFDLSAPHLMKMFNMLDRDHNGERERGGCRSERERGGCRSEREGGRVDGRLAWKREEGRWTEGQVGREEGKLAFAPCVRGDKGKAKKRAPGHATIETHESRLSRNNLYPSLSLSAPSAPTRPTDVRGAAGGLVVHAGDAHHPRRPGGPDNPAHRQR